MHEVSWVQIVLPEICWIALIQGHVGHRAGVELITTFARAARASSSETKQTVFGATSAYEQLSEQAWENIRTNLVETGDLFKIQRALEPLAIYYPECPFCRLFASQPGKPNPETLSVLKQYVENLHDRAEFAPMMTQATFVWLAFDAGVLKVQQGLALAEFPKIEDYPKTELSRRIGSGVRSTVNMFFGSEVHYPTTSSWPAYFWNRGLVIDSCDLEYEQ